MNHFNKRKSLCSGVPAAVPAVTKLKQDQGIQPRIRRHRDMLLSAHQIPWVKKKKEKLENAMDYSVTFCNVNFLRLWLELIRWIELLQLLSTKTCQSFCVKQSVRSVLCIILCILGDAIIAVAVESLIEGLNGVNRQA